MGFLIKILGSSFGPYIIGGLAALWLTSGIYLRWSGYNAGFDYATAKAAQERELAKDDALNQIIKNQERIENAVKENLKINTSINNEVRKQDETVEETVKTIIKEVPVYIDRDTCKRGYSSVIMRNRLATAASTNSESADDTSDITVGANDDLPEEPSHLEYIRRRVG